MQARRQEGFKGIHSNLYFGLQRFYTPPNYKFYIFCRLYLTAILVLQLCTHQMCAECVPKQITPLQ